MLALRRVRVVTRLSAGFLAVALCVLAIWAVALSSAGGTRTAATSLSDALARVEAAMQVKFRSADFNGWQTAYAFDIVRGAKGATDDTAPSRAAFLASMKTFGTELDTLAAAHLSASEAAAVEVVRTAFAAFAATDQEIIAGYRAGTPAAAKAASDLVLGRAIELFQQVSDGIDKVAGEAEADATAAGRAARSSADSTRNLATVLGILALAASILLAVLLTLSITRPLTTLRVRLTDIAEGEGDLTQRLDMSGRDEFTAVSRSFNTFVEKIAATIRGIAESASTVAAASEELTATSAQIMASSNRTATRSGLVVGAADEVSHNVQTVAAGAEEMGASIREIASNAAEAARVGDETWPPR